MVEQVGAQPVDAEVIEDRGPQVLRCQVAIHGDFALAVRRTDDLARSQAIRRESWFILRIGHI